MWPLPAKEYFAARRVANRLGLPQEQVLAVLSLGPSEMYRSWQQPKSHGGSRTISEPLEPLKSIQRALLADLYHLPVSSVAHGGVPKRSIVTNALPHVANCSALCLDLQDAFSRTCFMRRFVYRPPFGYPWPQKEFGIKFSTLQVVADLVDITIRGRRMLPQGGVTSNYVYNLICRELDKRLLRIAINTGGAVTRYVDNIVFSFPKDEIPPPLQRAIERQIQQCGFALNPEKQHHIRDGNRDGVPLRLPGINIIDGTLRLPPRDVRRMRMRLYCAGKREDDALYHGLKGHAFQIYDGMLPPQLAEVYEKACLSDRG